MSAYHGDDGRGELVRRQGGGAVTVARWSNGAWMPTPEASGMERAVVQSMYDDTAARDVAAELNVLDQYR